MMEDIEMSQPITIQGDNGGAVTATIYMNGKKLTDKTSVGQTTAVASSSCPQEAG